MRPLGDDLIRSAKSTLEQYVQPVVQDPVAASYLRAVVGLPRRLKCAASWNGRRFARSATSSPPSPRFWPNWASRVALPRRVDPRRSGLPGRPGLGCRPVTGASGAPGSKRSTHPRCRQGLPVSSGRALYTLLRGHRTDILSAITSERVETYLRKRLGSAIAVRGMRRAPVGLSRQTWFVDLGDNQLVVRIDNPGGIAAVPGSLEHEYDLYRLLSETPLPVAAPLWFEADPGILGAPFYLREYVDGSQSPDHFDDPDPRYDDARIEASKEHARELALVHGLDWGGLGLDQILAVPPSTAQSATATVDRIAAGLRGVAVEPIPVLEMITRWLREHAPPAPVTVLCKGSNGAMQEIWDGLTIIGLSDWELASIGDPANDWARCHGYLVEVPGQGRPVAHSITTRASRGTRCLTRPSNTTG